MTARTTARTTARAGTPWAEGRLLTVQPRQPRVLFGRMYEDPAVELAAFPPPAARVLCIASAGDTAAALAAAGYEVTAVDLNPAQLDYARGRLQAGAPAVPGSAERLLATGRAAVGTLLPAWRPSALERFLRLDDPAEQARHWRRTLDGPGLRLFLAASLRPAGALAVGLRPPFRGVVPERFDAVLRVRLARGFARHPNAANPWAWRLLLGRELPGGEPRGRDLVGPDLPGRDLPGGGAATAGPAQGTVRLLAGDVVDHLERSPAGHYDAVTLSNVLDGPGPEFARRLRAAVRHAVRPGGVAVLRSIREPGPAGPGAAAEDRSLLWGVVRVVRP
ncbi:DUF3419 family protein [Streptomyces sp. CB01881]|uniref:DUF3419 family protein n=1 Tax=Streptomyces sp. CB01881 TaxID=2078691 RepID=UPI000CDBD014|nr:DUF3419 family protein [Streptomyces sp. CB01881]AUY47670.1 DUF3419 domain-containing protein [Streptomyces sp. CB01881]TYC76143.1 DUF3419 family protein [Streptomyces sp. CB01881]